MKTARILFGILYLGGATVTHVRVGDAFVFPIIIGVLVWVAAGLRHPAVFRLAFGLTSSRSTTTEPQPEAVM